MAVVGARTGIFGKLREFVDNGKPVRKLSPVSIEGLSLCSARDGACVRGQVWGTCAGMILLADRAVMQKAGGQPLIGGLDVEVCRNFFGSQVRRGALARGHVGLSWRRAEKNS
jgi:5'-phosphate synthase pdxT subunit